MYSKDISFVSVGIGFSACCACFGPDFLLVPTDSKQDFQGVSFFRGDLPCLNSDY